MCISLYYKKWWNGIYSKNITRKKKQQNRNNIKYCVYVYNIQNDKSKICMVNSIIIIVFVAFFLTQFETHWKWFNLTA